MASISQLSRVVIEIDEGVDQTAAIKALKTAVGRVIHQLGPRLVIVAADLPDDKISERLPIGTRLVPLDVVPNKKALPNPILFDAFRLRQSAAFRNAKARRPHEGKPWGSDGLPAPDVGEDKPVIAIQAQPSAQALAVPDWPANDRLINEVAVGIVIVNGHGEYAISDDEKTAIVADVQEGLDWLGSVEPDANVSWKYPADIKEATVDITPWQGARWPGLPEAFYSGCASCSDPETGFDAAFVREDNGKFYVFLRDQYVRYTNVDAGPDAGYPRPIAEGWPGMPPSFNTRIDAAFWRESNGKVYIFKGNQYVRFSNVSEGVDRGYPKPITDGWPGMPEAFNVSIDAALMRKDNHKIYFFKGDQYVRFSNVDAGVDVGYPKNIADGWPGLPEKFQEGIDAALWRVSNNKIYLFKSSRWGGTYVRYTDVNAGVDDGYPLSIGLSTDEAEALWRDPALTQLGYPTGSDGLKHLLADIQAETGAASAVCAFVTKQPTTWYAYALRGRIVIRQTTFIGTNLDRTMAHETAHKFGAADEYGDRDCEKLHGFFRERNGNATSCNPNAESCIMRTNSYAMCPSTRWHVGWNAFMDKIDAAVWRNDNGKAYLFSKHKYVRFSDIAESIDDGYPKTIANGFTDLPIIFRFGIDAALWRADNNKLYFFKDNQYVRFSNVNAGVDAGYPKPIGGNWPGLPDDFADGIDAALWREDNGKVYLFKGSQYVRFSSVSEGVDPGYPKSIAGNWPGLPASFNNGIDAALMRLDNHKVYFFKGTQYVRFTNISDGIDPGYPNYINENWMPFPK